jgi:predicted Zn finger-like uncharacterized protein
MSKLFTNCPKCRNVYRVEESHIGKERKCKKCYNIFTVKLITDKEIKLDIFRFPLGIPLLGVLLGLLLTISDPSLPSFVFFFLMVLLVVILAGSYVTLTLKTNKKGSHFMLRTSFVCFYGFKQEVYVPMKYESFSTDCTEIYWLGLLLPVVPVAYLTGFLLIPKYLTKDRYKVTLKSHPGGLKPLIVYSGSSEEAFRVVTSWLSDVYKPEIH